MEDWKVIPDTDGLYWVSNYGEVWSCNGMRKGRLLTTYKDKEGYSRVQIVTTSGIQRKYVHQLVNSLFNQEDK